MHIAPHSIAPPSADTSEARATLLSRAQRRFGAIPANVIADHILAVTPGADFAVQEAALEALQRRVRSAQVDDLRVTRRPPKLRVLGRYQTARRAGKRSARPYVTELSSVEPLSASCDCMDFLSNALGVCKHVITVLESAFATVKGRQRIKAERALDHQGRLEWRTDVPLLGAYSPVTMLRLGSDAAEPQRAGKVRRLTERDRLRSLFTQGSLASSVVSDPSACASALSRLHRALVDGRLDGSSAAKAVVAQELARSERAVRNGAAAKDVLAALATLKRKLYPYQREGVARIVRAGRLLLADDMGLGKTTQAIAACHALHRAGRVERGLVVVPASLKPQWLREWQETTSVPAAVVDGAPNERERVYRRHRSGFLILNYEQLLRDFAHLQRLAPDMIVLDEAQRIKNYATKSAAYVKALVPEYRLALTGTPMENRLEELASIIEWLDPTAVAPKWRLVPLHTTWEGTGSARGKAGAKALDTLRARLAPCMMRRVRHEVLAQLPARTDTRVPVELTPQQVAAHAELDQPIAQLVSKAKRRPLLPGEFLRLMAMLAEQRIICNGLGQLHFEELWPVYGKQRADAALLEGLFAPKLLELRRLVSELALDQQRKIVVFSQWRRMLRLAEWSVRDVLGDAGLRAVFFTGAEKPAQRTRSVVDFHDDPLARVMFLSDAGGVGLNLQHAASACINLELPWNPAVLEQRIGRIYRLGQRHPIDVYNLVSEGGIESRIANVIASKQALFSGLFDGTSDELRFDTAASFVTQVERLVERDVAVAPVSSDAVVADEAEEVGPPQAPVDVVQPDLSQAPAVAPASALEWLPSLRIERREDGSVRIDAPPAAAAPLAAMFRSLADALSGGPAA